MSKLIAACLSVLCMLAAAPAWAQSYSPAQLKGAHCTIGGPGDETVFLAAPGGRVQYRRPDLVQITIIRSFRWQDGIDWAFVYDTNSDRFLGYVQVDDMSCEPSTQMSCETQSGRRVANRMVDQCNELNGRENMCNARRPCRDINREIIRGCAEFAAPGAQDIAPEAICNRWSVP